MVSRASGGNVAKRVLFVLTGLYRNGAVLSTLTTIRYLDREKFVPELFVLESGEAWPELLAGTPVTYGLEAGQRLKARVPQVLARLWHVVRRADLLVGGLEMTPTFLVVMLGKLTGKPSLGFVRNSLPELLNTLPRRYTGLTKRLYPGLTRVVAISSGIQESVVALIPALAGRVRTVYIPLELDNVQKRAQETLPEEVPAEPYLLAVGRLEPQKGFDVLLRAYARLRERGATHPLVIVGEGGEGDALRDLSRTLGVAEHVVFAGFQENPYGWLRGAAVFVSSSRFEGFCRVIAEALAVGTPVVATDCPSGPAEVLEYGRAGVLVANEDDAALADALYGLLGDEARQAELSRYGPERARAFSPEATVRAFEAVLIEAV